MPASRVDPSATVAPKLLTIQELADMLGLSYQAAASFIVRRLEPTEDSPVVYLGPHTKRVRLDRWLAWIEARTGQRPEPDERRRTYLAGLSRQMTATNRARRPDPRTIDPRTVDQALADMARGKE
jgi:hypothetical protein